MKGKAACLMLVFAALCFMVASSDATKNDQGKWALHFAGPHDADENTCDLEIDECQDLVVDAPATPGRYDVYIMAVDVNGIGGTRFGITCDGPFFFYGWTLCAWLEINTPGWPGCDEGTAFVWPTEQPGPYVTMGILDVYVYGNSELSVTNDPRVGFTEWCDFTMPEPICYKTADPSYHGSVGFGVPGFNPCRTQQLSATVHIDPSTLNLKSNGKYMTCYIELPDGYDPADIDVNSTYLHGILPALSKPTSVGDFDKDGIPDRMVKFSREDLINWRGGPVQLRLLTSAAAGAGPFGAGGEIRESRLWTDGAAAPPLFGHGKEVALTVSGQLTDGTPFLGRDVIRVIDPPENGSNASPALEISTRQVTTTTSISFEVANAGNVTLRIYDAPGRLVRTLLNEHRNAGTHHVTWDRTTDRGTKVEPGVYFIGLAQAGDSKFEKVVVVK